MKEWGLVCVAALLCGGPALAEGTSRVAVLDLAERAGVEAGTGSLLADIVRAELYAGGTVDLVEREQLEKVMAEQHLAASGLCDTATCSVQIGKLLGVPTVWSGSVGKLGSRYLLTLQVVNVTTAEVDRLHQVEADSLDALVDEVQRATRELLVGDPREVRARLRQGQELYDHERYDAAAAEFQAATRLNPESRDLWLWLARALQAAGREGEASNARARADAIAVRRSPGADAPPQAPPRAWIGVRISNLEEDMASALHLPDRRGALVQDVVPGSPAARGGVEHGDIVLKLDGAIVPDAPSLQRGVAGHGPYEMVELQLLRRGALITRRVTLEPIPPSLQTRAEPAPEPRASLLVAEVTLAIAQERGIARRGVLVTAVAPDSVAAAKGIAAGHIILEVGGQPVDSVRAYEAELQKVPAGDWYTLWVQDATGLTLYIPLQK